MRTKLGSSVLALLMVGACGRSSSSPTQPTSPATSVLSPPQLNVQIDSLKSSVAIAGVSRVSFDARATLGENLQFVIQFGDGAAAPGPSATHVYETAGTFTATVTVTDAAGRQGSSSQTVVVKRLEGSWYQFAYNERAREPEVRRLTISTQRGSTLQGVLVSGRNFERPLTGELTHDRLVRLVLDDGSEQYEGVVPSQVFGPDAIWPLTVRGGLADGMSLRFEPILGEPSGPPPVARLAIEIDQDGSTVGLIGFTPIRFVATESTGESLQYLIEFGDRQVATSATAVHPCTQMGLPNSRLTVVDRFGRASVTTRRYGCMSLVYHLPYGWMNFFDNPAAGRTEFRKIAFERQTGSVVSGFYTHPERYESHFTGELIGQNTLRIVLDGGGIEFTGRVVLRDSWREGGGYSVDRHLILTLRGGSANGATLDFWYYEGF